MTVGGGGASHRSHPRTEPSAAPDCLQPTFVPRSGFRQQVSAGVGLQEERKGRARRNIPDNSKKHALAGGIQAERSGVHDNKHGSQDE
jgi:hypothetical protein